MTEATEAPPGYTAVRFEHSPHLADILQQLGASLLISTYQAGKLVVVGSHAGKIHFSFQSFDRVMGLAVRPDRIAVGARRQVWFLESEPTLGPRVKPAGTHDACYLTRSCHFTGGIHIHEMAWSGEELWLVNTLFSCLCTLDAKFSFVPRWRPPFIQALAAEDRCHLNGLALDDQGRPRYVTVLGETDAPAGWRPNKAEGGCIIDVRSGETIARGLCMPHSPRLREGQLWALNSGRGQLVRVNPANGELSPVADLPGYTRGLCFHGPVAFVGLSRIRETAVFGGIPIAERREELKCGVAVVEVASGRTVATLAFHSGVEEIFDVQVLPKALCPVFSGPLPDDDGAETIWLVPSPAVPTRL